MRNSMPAAIYALFLDTVPDDVKRLYAEAATGDFAALAQAAHRLERRICHAKSGTRQAVMAETLEHLSS